MDVTCDDIGPAKILQLWAPRSGLRAMVVVDNTALGPAIGGVRVAPWVTLEEVARLARTMTLKNALAGLPHGGAKAGIVADPKRPDMDRLMQVFARMITELREYIPGPDMGSNEQSMALILAENGRACGLPGEIGGLPLDQLGATGFGVAICAEVACVRAELPLAGARVALQGFGNVGRAAARCLAEKGARIVAASDTGGTAWRPEGLPVAELLTAKEKSGRVSACPGARTLSTEELFALDCDILVPAAGPDVLHEGNADAVRARLIVPGANIAATAAAEKRLAERGVLVVPDFIANAGGVIMAAMEYAGKSVEEAFAAIEQRIRSNTAAILDKARQEQLLPRAAAEVLAKERVLAAMRYREFTAPVRS
jgi:glutamate dehydrogenase (NAD(P)+)